MNPRRPIQTLRWPLLALSATLALAVLTAGCGGAGHTPTDPASLSPSAAVTSKSAPSGIDPSHNQGSPQSQAVPVAAESKAEALRFELRPGVWNTDWTNAKGTVEAVLEGKGAADVDLKSIQLSGDNAAAAPLSPASTARHGHYVFARFAKSDAIKLLADPKPGDSRTLTLHFTLKGTGTQLTDTVRIVGPASAGSLHLRIAPDTWNTNFPHSDGTVAAFVRGEGVADIDLGSIHLIGDDSSAAPLAPLHSRRAGDQVVARFAMAAAFATLKSPKPGEHHKVILRFDLKGKQTDLSENVRIVGPESGD